MSRINTKALDLARANYLPQYCLIHYQNDLLFTPQEPVDFISKLKTLIDHPKLRQTMDIKAKASVSVYSWGQATKNLLKIWQQQIQVKSN